MYARNQEAARHKLCILDQVYFYSERRLLTGFASAAFILWKLTVIKAIKMLSIPAIIKTQIFIEAWYG